MSPRRSSPFGAAALLGVLAGCTAPNPAYWAAVPGDSPDADDGAAAVDARALPAVPDAAVPADQAPAPDVATVPPDSAPAPPILRDASSDGPGTSAIDTAPDTLPAITTGLVSRWRLDGTTGTTVLDDTGRNHGTLENAAAWSAMPCPRAPAPNPGAVTFDGVRSSVRLGTQVPALDQAKTVSLWFWIAATPTADRKDLFTMQNLPMMRAVQLGIERGKLTVWGYAVAFGSGVINTAVTAPPGWNHLAYTYDETSRTQLLYHNGAMIGMARVPPPAAPVGELLLGAFSTNSGKLEYFDGRLDDVRLYNRALTATEIAQLAAGAP